MTTSGTTVFSNTARDFIKQALLENAIIQLGEDPDPDEVDACLFRFNAMLKSWSARGLSWKQETITQAGVAATASITLPAYVREVNGCRYVDSATNERQMSRWERDEYYSYPNKASAGTPTIYYVDRNSADTVLYVWPVPSATFSLKLDIDRIIETITDAGETLDIPEEWTECVMANLALRCCNLFGEQPADELVARARGLEMEMFDAWRPASYFMGPA